MATSLNLVVIRVSDLEQSRRFYEALGLQFVREQHGKSVEHYSSTMNNVVFEIYPNGQGPSSTGTRLGFQVSSLNEIVATLQAMGVKVVSPSAEGQWGIRAVVVDPDGHKVELQQLLNND